MLELDDDLAADWFLDLWNQAPTPAKAVRLRETTIERFVKAHRLRRWPAPEVLRILKQKPLSVAPGVVEAASDHIRTLTVRIRLINQQLKSSAPQVGRALRPAHPVRGGRAGAALQAARRGDPAIHARARKDHPRRAARRGLAASAPARLSRLAQPVRGGPGDPPERQNQRRRAPLCLQYAARERALSLGAPGNPARCAQPPPLCRAAPARPRPRPAHRRRPL